MPSPRGDQNNMVRYELAIILRTVASSRLKESFKEAVVTILEEGALLRQFKNHGERQLPYRMKAHEQWHTKGRYNYTQFIYK